MRDDETFEDNRAAPAARGWRPAIGAAASLCALTAMIVWIYHLGARDASEVPVIRALAGEVKMRPEAPGGARFAHQDRAVYGVIDANAAQPGAPALAPAPEALAEEDVAGARLAAAPRKLPETIAAEAPAAAPAVAEPARIAEDPSDAEAFADVARGRSDAAPASEVDRLVAMVLGDPAASSAAFVDPGPAAPRLSPAAPPRPVGRAAALVRPVAFAADAQAPRAAAAAETAAQPGGPQIQIGAYLSRADAERMWDAFRARHRDLMAGRAPVISQTASGGKTLWLLRAAGFERSADAGALCDALRARGEECMLVRGG